MKKYLFHIISSLFRKTELYFLKNMSFSCFQENTCEFHEFQGKKLQNVYISGRMVIIYIIQKKILGAAGKKKILVSAQKALYYFDEEPGDLFVFKFPDKESEPLNIHRKDCFPNCLNYTKIVSKNIAIKIFRMYNNIGAQRSLISFGTIRVSVQYHLIEKPTLYLCSLRQEGNRKQTNKYIHYTSNPCEV